MNIIDIISKKKDNKELTYDEIKFAVDKYMIDEVKDYQMSALLMAIVINGMSDDEIYYLTKVMIESGEVLDLSSVDGIVVDKHSTGGVGDKTSLVVLPLVASCSVKIAKMSGRGLEFTGGTIDKLESIEGFNVNLTKEEFINKVNEVGIAITSQTGNLVPADKKIYALRDVTGTTSSIGLIASSIMSKKIASGADKIVLDVKVGKGAFMKNLDDAKKLSNTMIKIGKRFNKEVVAIISNMDYPLGYSVGNAIEVKEAIDTLSLKGDIKFTKLCITIASYMVHIGKNIPIDDAFDMVVENLNNKKGLEKFYELIKSQNGNIESFKIDGNRYEIKSNKNGYLVNIDTLSLAKYVNSLGAGRKSKDDIIDYNVGLVLNKKIGDEVSENDVLGYIITNKQIDDDLIKYFTIENNKVDDYNIILGIEK